LSGVSREPLDQLNEIGALVDDLFATADSRGVALDMRDMGFLEDLEDEEVNSDPDALAAILGRLRSMAGQIERGQYVPHAAKTDPNLEAARECRELREEITANLEAMGTEPAIDEYEEPTDEQPE
jgi:hypothetical protein